MKTVTLEVRSPEDGMNEFVQTWRSGESPTIGAHWIREARTPWKVPSAKRWELLLCGGWGFFDADGVADSGAAVSNFTSDPGR
jgi:hypothetical protein